MKQLNWYQIFGKSNIPDGRTVLPTDDIQIWLNCANIWDKTYTTLAEVLADTDTLLALINSSNAVDYMVRSTTWAVSASVPVMTSATTPSGKVTASAQPNASRPAWKAFNGVMASYNDGWQGAVELTDHSDWIDYEFDTLFTISKFAYFILSNRDCTYRIQGSNDGITYEDIKVFSNVRMTDSALTYETVNGKAYKHIRIYFDSMPFINGSSYYTAMGSFNFYQTPITDNSTAMSYIGLNNYCANTLLSDSTWCNAICNSEYFESVLNVKVPTMTSNNTPSGLCFVWQQYENQAYYVFDGNDTTYSRCVQVTSGSGYGYQFTSAKKILISKGRACHNSTTGYIRTEKIQYSDDGVTWSDSDTFTINENNGTKIEGDSMWYIPYSQMVSESSAHAYWRVFLTGATNNTRNGFFTINFYGREDV